MTDRINTYQNSIESFSTKLNQLDRERKRIPALRVITFLLTGLGIYWIVAAAGITSVVFCVIFFFAFLFFGFADFKLKKQIEILKQKIILTQQEIDSIKGDQSAFDPGDEFTDPDHNYTFDLDIFGKHSVFQMINRTASFFGKLELADYFKNAFDYSNTLKDRQEAVKELAEMPEFRLLIRLIFFGQQSKATDKESLESWIKHTGEFKLKGILYSITYVLPFLTISSIILAIGGLIGPELPGLLFLGQLFYVGFYGKQTLKTQQEITSQYTIIRKYSDLLHLIESTEFKSKISISLQASLMNEGQEKASKSIKNLAVLLNWLDSNLNLLVSILLNGLFMFNLHVLIGIERWKIHNNRQIRNWFTAIAGIDALSSLGNFAYNNPAYSFPEAVTNDFQFVAKEAGHPLIDNASCVTNDIEIRGWNHFCIITGANMSGKSTFLRTVGVNLVLAMTGAAVFAKEMAFSPVQIHSSIRTSDSLAKKESYFYAELKRLKQIIDELEGGAVKLILMDEVLKGTNSKDKQSGSIALIKQLLNYRSVGMFATHDLILGELQEIYPDNIINLCFEIAIEEERMVIDYKLQQGVCKNLNATFLMKKLGIIMDS